MRIPTLLAGANLEGADQPRSTPEAFDATAGLRSVGRAISGSAGAIRDVAVTLKNDEDRRQVEIEERWIGDSVYQFQNHISEWQANRENNGSEDYAQNFKKYAEDYQKTFESVAPTNRSAQAFRRRAGALVASRYDDALLTTERTRVENTKDSIINQTSFALDSFRKSSEIPNNNGIVELMFAHGDLLQRIQSTYGEGSIQSKKLSAYVDSEIALGLASQSPEMARSVITDSTNLEESAKLTLLARVDSLAQVEMEAGQDGFNQFRRDYMILVREGKRRDEIPIEEYKLHFGPAEAASRKAADDKAIKVLNRTNDEFAKISRKSARHQTRALGEMAQDIESQEDDLVYNALAQKTQEVQKLQMKDPVSWAHQYSPEVQEAQKKVAAASTPEQRSALRADLLRTIVKFQGVPSVGDVDSERYLRLPTLDQRVMTEAEVQASVARINGSSPGDAVKTIGEVLNEFVTPEFQDMAFNDMANGTEGIRQEYRLVWQNKDQWWVQNFVTALSDAKSFSALSENSRKEIDSAVDGDPNWKKFELAMVGPNGDRIRDIAAFKSGVMMYANYFSKTQGDDVHNSVKKSVDHLLMSTMGFTSVNGRTIMVLKHDGTRQLTDAEVTDMGRRLEVSLKDLDPREVDQSRFLALDQISPDKSNISRLQALRNTITRGGFFAPDNDGLGYVLYVKGDSGIPFPVSDTQGRNFMIRVKDLPQFRTKMSFELDPTLTKMQRVEVDSPEGSIVAQPQDTYDLQYGYQFFAPGVFTKKTHWPSMGSYWNRVGREIRSRNIPELDRTAPRIRDEGPRLIKPR